MAFKLGTVFIAIATSAKRSAVIKVDKVAWLWLKLFRYHAGPKNPLVNSSTWSKPSNMELNDVLAPYGHGSKPWYLGFFAAIDPSPSTPNSWFVAFSYGKILWENKKNIVLPPPILGKLMKPPISTSRITDGAAPPAALRSKAPFATRLSQRSHDLTSESFKGHWSCGILAARKSHHFDGCFWGYELWLTRCRSKVSNTF